jgi:hypothetical protein
VVPALSYIIIIHYKQVVLCFFQENKYKNASRNYLKYNNIDCKFIDEIMEILDCKLLEGLFFILRYGMKWMMDGKMD